MDRNTLMWSIVAFLGASIAFSIIQREAGDLGLGIVLLLELAALGVMVLLIVLIVRWRDRGDRGR